MRPVGFVLLLVVGGIMAADDLAVLLARNETARTAVHTDPTIQRALTLLAQPVNPVRLVTPNDYDAIGLPKPLHPFTSKQSGFRVRRGETADPDIFINKDSPLYKAAQNTQNQIAATVLASTIAHEQTHSTEHGSVGERAAQRIQADWLRTQVGNLPPRERDRLWAYIRELDAGANNTPDRRALVSLMK